MKKATTKKTSTPDTPELPAETREAKLKRLADKRVIAAVKRIRLIGNLAAYKPTDEQIDRIVEALVAMTQSVEARMRGQTKTSDEFSL